MSDFVKVRLTKEAREIAPIQIVGGRQEFRFEADTVEKVTRAHDWEKVLRGVVIVATGKPMFEVVEDDDKTQGQDEVIREEARI